MRIFGIVTLVIFLAGCATSYQERGLSGGYENQEIGPNKYQIVFRGNGFTSPTTVHGYALRRANELCASKGFEEAQILSDNSAVRTIKTADNIHCTPYGNTFSCSNYGGNAISKHSAELIVKCISKDASDE